MAKFHEGNMWNEWDNSDLFLVTTNSFIKKNKHLTMGRGMAKEIANFDDQVPLYFGRELLDGGYHMRVYGLFIPILWPIRKEGAFQTKIHWQDRAEIPIIKTATTMLNGWARHNNQARINLNFPGIGYGGLDKVDVLPILEKLPDNVHIWELN